jgi:flagellar biosynthesis protein FlhG
VTAVNESRTPSIVPVAGGKGGIGKSIIAANTAVTLAKRGFDVIAMDLDLGASNLHAIFGIRNSEKNIMTFAANSETTLEEMALSTKYPGTRIICGAANFAGAADLPAKQKLRIIHSIETLSCDYVILDLGAGSSFNVTDFFLTGEMGVIVMAPEITSVLDAYSFLKTALYRRLQLDWQHEYEVRTLIEAFKDPRNTQRIETVEGLIEEVGRISRDFAHQMRLRLQRYGIKIVLNKVRRKSDFQVVSTIQQLAAKNLSLKVYNAGYVPFDSTVQSSVNKMAPFVHLFPQSPASRQMGQLARAIAASPFASAQPS